MATRSPVYDGNSDLMPKDSSSVYGAVPTSANERDAREAFRYRTFRCPRCHTEFSVTKADVGKTLVCPDCETKVVVPADLNFDIETDYERQYYNADKKRRDALFSPVRNPNREGIDLANKDVYTVKNVETEGVSSKDEEEYYPVLCRVCETLMQAPRKMLGRKIKCPDCGTETIITDALKKQQKAIDVKFDPQVRGIYGIGEIPEEPPLVVQGSDGRHIVVDRNTNTLAPDPKLREIFEQKRAQNKKKKRAFKSSDDLIDGAKDALAEELRKDDKNIFTAFIAWREKRRKKRKAVDDEDLRRFLPPLVLRPRDGELVWTLASPPKKAPLFNKTFRAIFSEEIWTRGALIAIAFVMIVYLVCDWILPASGVIETSTIGPGGRMVAEAEMALAISMILPLVLCASSLLGLFFWSVFGAGNSGASRVVDWRGEDIPGFLGYGIWFATLVAVAFLPGLLTVTCLDLTVKGELFASWNTESASLTSVLTSASICWGSFWLFFPIFWLSTTQNDWPFCPINGRVFTSFFSQFLVWSQFYTATALFFYAPSVLWSLSAIKGYWFWYVAPAWTLFVPMIFGLLLGRLSWILDDEVRSMDFDD